MEQTIIPCGGNSETIFLCDFGNIEVGKTIFQSIKEKVLMTIFPVLPPEPEVSIFFYLIIFFSLFLIGGLIWFFVRKKKKK